MTDSSSNVGTSSPVISICIPTFNRAAHLDNCLNSIAASASHAEKKGIDTAKFEICISNNGSTDATENVVRAYEKRLPIRYSANSQNIGIPRNFLKVVSMAKGEFCWLVGDDDLFLHDTVTRCVQLIETNPEIDHIYGNAYHLDTDYVAGFPAPFDIGNLPPDMEKFSKFPKEGKLPFLKLVNPDVSFDFLGGMFLSIFRKANWDASRNALSETAIQDQELFSHFDNTFPHVKVFAYGLSSSQSYFSTLPLLVCLTGAREWAPLYQMIKAVRLVEATLVYRKCGLDFWSYYKCRNATLASYWPCLGWALFHPRVSGLKHVFMTPTFLTNFLFPNFWLSPLYYFARKLTAALKI